MPKSKPTTIVLDPAPVSIIGDKLYIKGQLEMTATTLEAQLVESLSRRMSSTLFNLDIEVDPKHLLLAKGRLYADMMAAINEVADIHINGAIKKYGHKFRPAGFEHPEVSK